MAAEVEREVERGIGIEDETLRQRDVLQKFDRIAIFSFRKRVVKRIVAGRADRHGRREWIALRHHDVVYSAFALESDGLDGGVGGRPQQAGKHFAALEVRDKCRVIGRVQPACDALRIRGEIHVPSTEGRRRRRQLYAVQIDFKTREAIGIRTPLLALRHVGERLDRQAVPLARHDRRRGVQHVVCGGHAVFIAVVVHVGRAHDEVRDGRAAARVDLEAEGQLVLRARIKRDGCRDGRELHERIDVGAACGDALRRAHPFAGRRRERAPEGAGRGVDLEVVGVRRRLGEDGGTQDRRCGEIVAAERLDRRGVGFARIEKVGSGFLGAVLVILVHAIYELQGRAGRVALETDRVRLGNERAQGRKGGQEGRCTH